MPRADGLHRGGQEPGRVAAGDADPGVAGVDPEPYAVSHGRPQASAAARPTSALDRGQRLVDAARVGAAALGDVVLAAAACRRAHRHAAATSVVRRDARVARRVVDRDHDGDLAVAGRR